MKEIWENKKTNKGTYAQGYDAGSYFYVRKHEEKDDRVYDKSAFDLFNNIIKKELK